MKVWNLKIAYSLLLVLLPACSTMVPVDFNPNTLAYAVLDKNGSPTRLCFDTISPNHCIQGGEESMIERFNLKKRILLQHYILILGEPSQIDCKLNSPRECRVYFEHIHVDITINPQEFDILKQEMKNTDI